MLFLECWFYNNYNKHYNEQIYNKQKRNTRFEPSGKNEVTLQSILPWEFGRLPPGLL